MGRGGKRGDTLPEFLAVHLGVPACPSCQSRTAWKDTRGESRRLPWMRCPVLNCGRRLTSPSDGCGCTPGTRQPRRRRLSAGQTHSHLPWFAGQHVSLSRNQAGKVCLSLSSPLLPAVLHQKLKRRCALGFFLSLDLFSHLHSLRGHRAKLILA